MKPHPFVRFVSPVEGRHVTRFGTRDIIGGSREPLTDAEQAAAARGDFTARGAGIVRLNLDYVAALTAAEWDAYGREYKRALRDGSLRERTEAEWRAHVSPPQTVASKKGEV